MMLEFDATTLSQLSRGVSSSSQYVVRPRFYRHHRHVTSRRHLIFVFTMNPTPIRSSFAKMRALIGASMCSTSALREISHPVGMLVWHSPLPIDFAVWLFGLQPCCSVLHCFLYAPVLCSTSFTTNPRVDRIVLGAKDSSVHCTTYCSHCRFFADFQTRGDYYVKTRKVIFSSS